MYTANYCMSVTMSNVLLAIVMYEYIAVPPRLYSSHYNIPGPPCEKTKSSPLVLTMLNINMYTRVQNAEI